MEKPQNPAVDWSRHPRILRTAVVLRSGGVVAYPTEAVWGLGCAPAQEAAVRRLLALKQRSPDKGLILVAADIGQLEPYLEGLSTGQRQTLADTWPGPVTWLVPANGRAGSWITGQFDTLAVRVTNHPLVQGLCRAFDGPLVSTSANPQGRPPARTALAVRRYFGQQLDYITPGQVGGRANPSEIRHLVSGQIARPG
ncbi:tRNA threonylcarbamoyladenosine biosynthesis protein RimN [Exilibacterium tricleocarpae]|uniref:Threonylcarbamoyl-AMP synthase n=1 Tax=Exilibacterium tricleocarpae TaxID=2591008 RepID=A0A545T0H2_9GAMM|nr:Sua5/YciO/YrdC/YwlC family protein [Exilibacterium tricleocarpae]TQV70691.1 tRNA threonylcarbamoyladenosine biosynthesis protein RimN [Exilibacterium tricleocarpae]